MAGERKVYSVAELTRRIKNLLESDVGTVWVQGEVSNLRVPSSGHSYFTLKDENAQISAVLFRGQQEQLQIKPKDGVLLRVFGSITVYEKNGNYQIIVSRVEDAGKGSLQAQFEELKKRLDKEGFFDQARKRAIPLLPQHIGIVTSPTGAAIRDILKVLSMRFANLHVLIAPVRVQGDGAGAEIAGAIDFLNARGGLDVLIVGRGGGSLEDLWCFNEEVVARAIARSRIPVISAVGHEIDFTISDFVADLRAPTPSAAAEMVIASKRDLQERVGSCAGELARLLRERALELRNRFTALERSYVFREPVNMLKQHTQMLDNLELRMVQVLRFGAGQARQTIADAAGRMQRTVRQQRQTAAEALRHVKAHLQALSPLAVLGRGYSIMRDERGRIIRSKAEVSVGQLVYSRFVDGTVTSEVKGCHDSETNR